MVLSNYTTSHSRQDKTGQGQGNWHACNIAQKQSILNADINIPPYFQTCLQSDKERLSWQNYCNCIAAFKLHPWHPLRERCIAMLATYLGQTSLGQATCAAIIRTVEAQLRNITLYQGH